MASSATPQIPPGTFEETLQPEIYGISAMFAILVTVVVALRFASRRIGKVAWKWDDLWISLAYIFYLILIGTCIASAVYGDSGRHIIYFEFTGPLKVLVFAKFTFAISMIYLFAVTLPKLALLSIYLDIFIQKPLRILCWVCAGVTIANWFANTIAGFKSCTPLSEFWTRIGSHESDVCFDVNAWWKWASFPNIVTDVVMLILPIPTVIRLQVPTSVRFGVAITFLLGSSGLIASIFRFTFFYLTDFLTDGTWSVAQLIIWTEMEVGMYIIAASLPTYRPILRSIGSKYRSINASISRGLTSSIKNSHTLNDSKLSSDRTDNHSRLSKEIGEEEEDTIALFKLPNNQNLTSIHTAI